MRIAYFQNSYGGAQVTGYPAARDLLPLIRRLIEDGNEVIQAFPRYTDNGLIHKYFADETLRNQKLQEQFVLGVKPITSADAYDSFDLVIAWAIPWSDRNTYILIEELGKFADAGVPIVYICADYEFDNKKSGASVFFSTIFKENKNIWDKLAAVTTTVPGYKEKILEIDPLKKVLFIPTLYHPGYEIPIKPLEEKTQVFGFTGPIAFRNRLYNHLHKFVGLNNLKCTFFNESDKEAKKSRVYNPVNVYKDYADDDRVDILETGLYLPYKEYLETTSQYLFSFGDSTFEENGILGDRNFHTSRLPDGLYAGNITMFTDTKTVRDAFKSDVYIFTNIEYINRSDIEYFTSSSEVYKSYVERQRAEMNRCFGIDKWYPVYKQVFLDAINGN